MPANNITPPRSVVDELLRIIREQVPGLGIGTVLSIHLLQRVAEIIKKNIVSLMAAVGTVLTTAGLAMLLPSLCVVIVNALGFTASGVLAGSVAAAVQSAVYGATTGGVFSALQAFGATAAVASPAGLIIGGVFLGIGVGCLGWWLWRRYRRSQQDGGPETPENGPSDKGPSDPSKAVVKRPGFNFFDFFSR